VNRSFQTRRSDQPRPFDHGLFDDSEYDEVATFYAAYAGYEQTPLRDLPGAAVALGIAGLLVKDESHRFGHASFKALGVGYAVARLLATADGRSPAPVLASATDGNHGHALARVARQRGLRARIYVHQLTRQDRIDAISAEGAEVIVVPGTYDDAVRAAADEAREQGWQVVSDTSWEGYTQIPRWIMAGYTQMMREVSEQWKPASQPDIVIVQAGVGAFACGITSWLARWAERRPFVIVCEPSRAACLLESAAAGQPTVVGGNLETIMDGLSCGEVSRAGWPAIAATVDAYVAIDDEWAVEAMRMLTASPYGDATMETGASGAAGLAALLALTRDPLLDDVRRASGLSATSRVLVFNTEGALGNPFSCIAERDCLRDFHLLGRSLT
jgi:diaminopropionate ammonia-lyase